MCGIFGYIGEWQDAATVVLDGLKRLEYRGYDSWGIAVAIDGKVRVEKKIGKIGQANTTLPKSSIGLGHTRWATHGGVTEENAHPHFDCSETLAIIHNGIVENYQELKDSLNTHRFKSETDTEVIVHLLEDALKKEKDFLTAFRDTFGKLKGLNAVAALYENKIIVGKNGSPIVLGKSSNSVLLASDASALLPITRDVIFLEDHQLAVMEKDKVSIFDIKSGEAQEAKWQTLDWKVETAQLGDFEHYMLKEIYEQPKVIRNVAENLSDQIADLSLEIKKARGTYFIGSGTASYACLAGTYLFSKIASRHVNTAPASEFNYLEDFLTPESLIIALSQSGETIDVVEPLTRAKSKGSKVVAIVNNLGSTIYRMADYKLLLGAGPEMAVASTKAYTAKIAILVMMAYAIKGDLETAQKLLLRAADEVERIIEKENLTNIRKICKDLIDREHIYVIGRGLSFPSAMEATLKIKEVSYIHAEGLAGGELKHGPIALIDKGTPCIVFAPGDETYDAIISNATEIKARGGKIIGVGSKRAKVFDEWVEVRDCGEATLIPQVIPAQLFGYFLALEKGYDPDKPRNLAKSVTVK